ncbi:uncharacterized protein LOC121808972 [Salvia splendens]|uniref:uncharacterized protein LOC121808972 n=1 Tax=Salvia splendens TaxID=180675 RepID=UPI001C27132C|nr:uncharacterized protein LOC121808972 [Salvia splendens]
MAMVLHDGTADAQIIHEAKMAKGLRNGAASSGGSPMEIASDGDRSPAIKAPMKKASDEPVPMIEPQRLAPAVGRNFQGLRFAEANESGHIWILAHEDWTLEVVDDSRQALHVKVSTAVFPFPVYITIAYGRHSREARQALWEKLGDISLAVEGRPRLVGGDFNIFLTNEERQGNCQLIDLSFDWPIFTWHRPGLWERLDRILIGEHWTSVFATTRVTHLVRFSSDHAPLLLKLIRIKKFIKVWNREVFGSILHKLKDAEKAVLEAQTLFDSDPTPVHRADFSRVSAELIVTTKMEEDYWRQKAAVR